VLNIKKITGFTAGSVLFVGLTFAFSWLFWWPGMPERLGIDPILSGLIGAFGPSLAGVVTVVAMEGRKALGGIMCRLLWGKVGLRWYIFVLFYPAIVSIAATLVVVLSGGAGPNFAQPLFVTHYPLPPEAAAIPFMFFLPVVFIQQTLVGSSMGEELGWRGYWLPRLQARFGAFAASIFLGLVWGFWHLPLALNPGDIRSETFFGWSVLGAVATAMIFTWVYNHTRGSLLIALLLHTSINITGLFLAMGDIHPAAYLLLSWILPLFILVRTRGSLGFDQAKNSLYVNQKELGLS
jgi:uncharacterized protein